MKVRGRGVREWVRRGRSEEDHEGGGFSREMMDRSRLSTPALWKREGGRQPSPALGLAWAPQFLWWQEELAFERLGGS